MRIKKVCKLCIDIGMLVITPMLITFCGFTAYEAVGIALASDVLASAVTAYTYGKNKNLDRSYAPFFQESILGCSADLLARAGVCCF